MDGLTLLDEIRYRPELDEIKVVLISAAPIKKDRPVKADEYLAKPYDIDSIDKIVNNLLKTPENP